MNLAKKVLAVLALVCMAVFIVSVIVLTVAGTIAQHSIWVYGSLTCFLICGLGALTIRWVMKQLDERRKAEETSAKSQEQL